MTRKQAALLLLLLLGCARPSAQQEEEQLGLVLPLKRRDGGLIARGLLRNATLPLHGAVKDYGCAVFWAFAGQKDCVWLATFYILKGDSRRCTAGSDGKRLTAGPWTGSSPSRSVAEKKGWFHAARQVLLCDAAPGHARAPVCRDCGHRQHHHICTLRLLRPQLRPAPQGKPLPRC